MVCGITIMTLTHRATRRGRDLAARPTAFAPDTRRVILFVLGFAVAVAALGPSLLRAQSSDAPASSTRAFTACLERLRVASRSARVHDTTWRIHMTGVQPSTRVIAASQAQPEQQLSIWDYIAATVDEERLDDGRRLLREHQATLAAIERRYRVDPATVIAVWGLESNYGKGLGGLPLVSSLATLSCEGRRQAYFRRELFAVLRILQAGHMPADQLKGSWAGAFGHVQFMPGTFEWLAVDFDGDGRRDLMGSIPDALASAANFLRTAGWRNDQPWGIEVRLPVRNGVPFSLRGEGRRVKRPLSQWTARGVRRVDGTALTGGPLTASTRAALIAPAGAGGPAFLVFRNYDAIFRYNGAQSYAIAIAHLADRLRGAPPFVTPWPTDDLGLSRAERREMQRLLTARGHDIGAIDGVLTARTRAAIRSEQAELELPVDGRPGQRFLEALRAR